MVTYHAPAELPTLLIQYHACHQRVGPWVCRRSETHIRKEIAYKEPAIE